MKYHITRVITSLFLLAIISSCVERRKVKDIMLEFVSSDIIIPDDLDCIFNAETSASYIDTLKSNKLIIYYDSLDCSSCRISHLFDLYPLYTMADTSDFSVMTIFSPKKSEVENTRFQLMLINHTIPIYLDKNGSFAQLNSCIPTDQRFHSFLINEIGSVLFVGNPISNEQLHSVFLKTLNKTNN